ncbi:MAG TPA: nitrilase-related carbon-nitrogen hydrolase [Jatrophihabitantaceae bacterium]|jgi:predicted amidohydrolase|nr:nitrilase-related carbon-nitrogen hydrolase [Jatrophihabitantaceae bacterium]
MKIAAIQHDIVFEDAPATRARVGPLIAQAAAGGAKLIALTEMFATGFSMRPERIAEDEGGPNEQFLIEQARCHQAWIVASIAQWGPGGAAGKARNVAVLAAPDGSVHRYAKIHPFSYAREDEFYQAGQDFLTVDVGDLRVSVFVCYDLRFADEFWALATETDLYVVVANWPAPRREHWRALLRARAIENQAYVLGVNRVGSVLDGDVSDGGTKELAHLGDSAVIDPLGRTLAEASHGEAVLIAEANSAEVAQVRARFPFLADRRTPD